MLKLVLTCPNCGSGSWIRQKDGAFECGACRELVFPENMLTRVERDIRQEIGFKERLAAVFPNPKNPEPGCYNVLLTERNGHTLETQGDIPDDPDYGVTEFAVWLMEDIEEIGLEPDQIDIVSVEYAGLQNTTDVLDMTVFCDSTDLYTDEEIEQENLTSLEFPRVVVRKYYEYNREPEPYCSIGQCEEAEAADTFESWLNKYTADETTELYYFAKNMGFEAQRYEGGIK